MVRYFFLAHRTNKFERQTMRFHSRLGTFSQPIESTKDQPAECYQTTASFEFQKIEFSSAPHRQFHASQRFRIDNHPVTSSNSNCSAVFQSRTDLLRNRRPNLDPIPNSDISQYRSSPGPQHCSALNHIQTQSLLNSDPTTAPSNVQRISGSEIQPRQCLAPRTPQNRGRL